MKRTISFKLKVTHQQSSALQALQEAFSAACNYTVPQALEKQCCNRVALHHIVYYNLRAEYPLLGSQMACNVVRAVASAYKSLLTKKTKYKQEAWPRFLLMVPVCIMIKEPTV